MHWEGFLCTTHTPIGRDLPQVPKVNAAKCSFGLKEIPYLGYIISMDGVKPDPKKIQEIMDLAKQQTAKEMKSFIGMIQFYRDMWK